MENEKIVVSQKKSTLVICIISLFFACIVMIFMIFNVEVGDGGRMKWLLSTPFGVAVAKVFFAVCAVLCVYSAVIFIKRLINYKPLIVVDESGFTDSSNANSVGFVPWRDVKRIYMVTMKHNKLIQVELEYPEEYLNRMGGLARKAAELNMKLGYQPISFSLNGTGKNPDKFLADMISIWERNK
ncbi:MAG: hypothetical protein K2N60_06525 [Oscillospiraceae bacterium]|nr:hypothetical protein [Oscillospiraceae bacterium]